MLRNHRPFHFQQPFFRLQSLTAAVAVELAIRADQAVTGDDDGHGVGGIGASHSTIGAGTVDLQRDLRVGASFSLGDLEYRLQRFLLKGTEDRPVNGKGKFAA